MDRPEFVVLSTEWVPLHWAAPMWRSIRRSENLGLTRFVKAWSPRNRRMVIALAEARPVSCAPNPTGPSQAPIGGQLVAAAFSSSKNAADVASAIRQGSPTISGHTAKPKSTWST